MYKAEGPTTDARNADTTPEPLPTSTHTLGLEIVKRRSFNFIFLTVQTSYICRSTQVPTLSAIRFVNSFLHLASSQFIFYAFSEFILVCVL